MDPDRSLTVARVAWLLLCLLALVAGSASGWAALRAASPSEPARTEQALPRFSGPLVGGGHGGSQLLANMIAIGLILGVDFRRHVNR